MSVWVFLVVLFAAGLHAGWNAVVKQADDKLLTTVLVAAFAGLVAVVVLPFLAAPAPAARPWIAGSVGLQIVYFLLVAQAYRRADMSLAYPVMRGAAPLLVTIAAVPWLGEVPSPLDWVGVALISAGIASAALAGRRGGERRGLLFALVNAGVIAAYTLVDGVGVRLSNAPAAYTLWSSLLTAPPLVAWIVLRRGWSILAPARAAAPAAFLGGVGTVTSYGLALWAMTSAPIGEVAALRETSILFGLAIAGVVFGETIDARRLIAAALVLAGTVALRLG